MSTTPIPRPTTYTPKVTDPKMIKRLKDAAKAANRPDWRNYSNELVERALKMVLGVEVDLRPKEVAAELGVHLNSFWNYHKQGMFPNAYYTTTHRLRVPYKDIEAIKQRTVQLLAG